MSTATAHAYQQILDITPEIIVDLFAGGGGVSEGVEMALGFPPHVAVNHNHHALSMHQVNHPFTSHHIADVFEICPKGVVVFHRRPVGALHLSPDCTHHSQASGGQPRDRKIRALSWVAVRWAGQVKPRVITLENVKQILKWGPLIAKRDPDTGRVMKLDKTIAAPGERVPLNEQFLVPDPKRVGKTWNRFVRTLEAMGYCVETRKIVASDLGAGTTRERLYMIARCDGHPIVWPEPTHAKTPHKGQKSWKPAGECIDWSIPCPSIFERKRPLAPATMKRIARGMKRYVLDSADPFMVPIAHYNGSEPVHSVREPLRTVTAFPKDGCRDIHGPIGTITGSGGHAIAAATLVQTGYGERGDQAPRSLDIQKPLGTVVAGGVKHALASAHLVKFRGESVGHGIDAPVPTITSGAGAKRPAGAAHALGLSAAYLMQANGGFCTTPGHDVREPMSTITNSGSQQQCVTAHLAHLRGNCDARDLNEPLHTVSAGGQHHAVVEYRLSPEHEAGALRVAEFLMEHYSESGPLNAITAKDRLALVTVVIQGTPYVIVDIGLRMLTPRELYRAQGFREDYIIDYGHDGRKFTKDQQVRMVGNSVPPDVIAAIYRANIGELALRSAA